nr:uncharacterized protein LOC113739093 [Coffea arabica]
MAYLPVEERQFSFIDHEVSVGAEAILKSECDLFEKSKKMRLYPKNSKANEERQQDNREVVENQEKEPNDAVNYEEDEVNNIDDDIDEEDFDAYEAIDPIGFQEGDFSPQQDSCILVKLSLFSFC